MNVLDKSDTGGIPSALIDITEAGTPRRSADYSCLLGRDLIIDAEQLSRYCLRDLDPVVDDLVVLAGAVAFSDRVIARKISVAWRRNLQVSIPVHDPDFWSETKLSRSVTSTLDALTGDNWTLLFKPRKRRTEVKPQSVLPLGVLPSLVMPYSDGLDSFAAARLVSAQNPGVSLVLVTTGKRRTPALDTSNSSFQRQMYRGCTAYRSPFAFQVVREEFGIASLATGHERLFSGRWRELLLTCFRSQKYLSARAARAPWGRGCFLLAMKLRT